MREPSTYPPAFTCVSPPSADVIAAYRRHAGGPATCLNLAFVMLFFPAHPSPGSAVAHDVGRLIISLLALRAETASICPSEVARAINPDGWRALMAPIRAVAVRLAQAGVIDITQRGAVVPPTPTWRGPIRLRRGPSWSARR